MEFFHIIRGFVQREELVCLCELLKRYLTQDVSWFWHLSTFIYLIGLLLFLQYTVQLDVLTEESGPSFNSFQIKARTNEQNNLVSIHFSIFVHLTLICLHTEGHVD